MSIWSRIERRLSDIAGDLLPDDVREQLGQARDKLTSGDPDGAIEILKPVIDARPEHVGALSLLGVAELERGDATAALAAFDQAIEARDDVPDSHVGRGQALSTLGEHREASMAFRRAVECASGDREILSVAYRGAGRSFRRLGELDKAVRELRKAVAEAPRDPHALTALGEALYAHPDISADEASKYLSWARESEAPPLAFLIAGQIALDNDRDDEAAELFLAAANRDELSGDGDVRVAALIGTSDVMLRAGDLTEAHQSLLRALELAPKNAAIHSRLAALHVRSGNPEAAFVSYDRSIELAAQTDVLETAVRFAIDHLGEGDTTRLREYLDALEGRERSLAQTLLTEVGRGVLLAADGDSEAAMVAFEGVLERGDSPDAQLGLAALRLEESPTLSAEHALNALRAAPVRTRNRARELLGKARRAELGLVSSEADQSSDLIAAFTGLERLFLARPELGALTRGVSEAASDFDRPLLVTVMGEFSSGKSTFVNAFIGAEVAPTGITPTTATINVVRHGRERGGRILYRDDRTEDVPWEELFGRLRGLDAAEAALISRVEILLPLDVLERVNLVDTPGLNSILPEHEQVARDFIARADAVVWVFSANQAGKKSEGLALGAITSQGVRVLGALNKIDQLSEDDVVKVTNMVNEELGDKLEGIVPVSARRAAAGEDGSRWDELEMALEAHFFARAKSLKASAAKRKLTELFSKARAIADVRRDAIEAGATALREAATQIRESAATFADDVTAVERRTIATDLGTLYRDAAREVLELVLPRSLPFGSNKASPADRDYLISLLETRMEAALGRSRRRVDAAIRETCAIAIRAENEASGFLGPQGATIGVAIEDATRLFDAKVYSSALAFLRGFLRGGYVEHFFRSDLPKLDLAEDAVYHALYRDAPNVDALVGKQLGGAGEAALASVIERLESLARNLSAQAQDLQAGTLDALTALESRVG